MRINKKITIVFDDECEPKEVKVIGNDSVVARIFAGKDGLISAIKCYMTQTKTDWIEELKKNEKNKRSNTNGK